MINRPPSLHEKYQYVDSKKSAFYYSGLVSSLFLISGMLLFTSRATSALFYAPFVAVISVYLGVSYLVGIFSQKWAIDSHRFWIQRGLGWAEKQDVDVFYCVCREKLETVLRALEAIKKLKWTSGELRIHVLNDGFEQRNWLKHYCDSHGFNLIERTDQGVMKKAGNLRHAFKITCAPFLAIFDADFCPRPEFLYDVMPHFHDSKVGIVQTPQFFSVIDSRGWVQKGAAQIQELFYRLIQPARDYWGAPICVGTNAVYRRKALEPMGGTYPIEYSEDIHTGFSIGSYGYLTRYIPIILAGGECPDTVSSFFSQQYRWCLGSVSLLTSRIFWRNNSLTLMRRICYLSGMFYYVATALGVIFNPLPGLYMVYFAPEYLYWFNYLFVIPSFLFGTVFMALWSTEKFGVYSLKARFVSYWAHLFAIIDKLRGNLMPWIPTGERQSSNARVNRFYIASQSWLAIVLALGLYGVYRNIGVIDIVNLIPFIFFLALNSVVGFIDYRDVFGGKKR